MAHSVAPPDGVRTRSRSTAWRRTGQVALVGLLAGAAIGLTAAPGLAATGRIHITSATGPRITLVDPPAGCHSISRTPPSDSVVWNQTDAAIVVYAGVGCAVYPAVILEPGESAAFVPRSIDVLSR